MQNFPPWKQTLILGLCALGILIALPNAFYGRVERANDARTAMAAGEAATPELIADAAGWPRWLPSRLINLGLDLRGGAHVLVQVETADVYGERMEGIWPVLRDRLRELRDEVGTVRRLDGPADELHIRVGDPAGVPAALEAVQARGAAGLLVDRRVEPRVRGARRGRHDRGDADRGGEGGDRPADDAAEPRDHPPPRRRDRHPRAVDPAAGRGPHPRAGAGDRLGRGAAGRDRQDRAAVVPPGGEPDQQRRHRAGARPVGAAVDGRGGDLLRARPALGGDRRPARRRTAELRPEQPAGGELPLQPGGRRRLRPVHGREHRQPVRDRARRASDLGASDPGAHLGRLGDHHRQLHTRGVVAARDPAARRRAAGGDHRARAAHGRAGARGRTRSGRGRWR